MTRVLCFALAMSAAPLAAQVAVDTGAHPIRLAEAIRLAQANSPATVAARGQTATSTAGLRSAYAAFIPTVSLNMTSAQSSPVSHFNSTGQAIPANPWQLSQGFSLGLEFFSGGKSMYNVASARALLGAAEANEVAQRYQVAYDVKVQYYAVLGAREAQRAAQAALDAAQQQLKVSVAKVKAKTVTKSDSLRSLVQVGNARLQILSADLTLQQSNAALTRLVATPTTVTASEDDTLGASGAALDSAMIARLALAGPSVRAANAQADAAHTGALGSRSAWLPTMSVAYGRQRTTADSAFTLAPGGTYSGQLRFSMSYPIFNQWLRESSIVQADVAAANADAQARDTKYAAQQNLVQYLGALRTAQQQFDIQAVSVAAAEEDLRVQQERYSMGVSTILDVLTSQSGLNAARVLLIQARFNYRVAKAQLEALVGSDL